MEIEGCEVPRQAFPLRSAFLSFSLFWAALMSPAFFLLSLHMIFLCVHGGDNCSPPTIPKCVYTSRSSTQTPKYLPHPQVLE